MRPQHPAVPSRRPPHQVRTVTCAATGCQATINAPLLMCVDHWRLVPVALRREIWARYRERDRVLGARDKHATAVQAAIDAVHTKQLSKKAKADAGTPSLF